MEQEHAQSDVDALAMALAASQQAIEELRAEVAELRRERRNPPPVVSDVRPEPIVSRRALFGLAGAGIAGVAVGAGASPVGAADGDPLLAGRQNESTSWTGLASSNPLVLDIMATTGDFRAAVLIQSISGALWGIADADGARAVAGTAKGVDGQGLRGSAPQGIGVMGDSAEGIGVMGDCADGTAGVFKTRTGAHLWLRFDPDIDPDIIVGPPRKGEVGMIATDGDGDLFLCTEAGTPGTWTRLNHQAAAFLPDAERAFDSRDGRQPIPGGGAKGIFTARSTRAIDLTVATGLPVDASAAIINLTVTGTDGAGYLSVYAGDVIVEGSPTFSHINWTTSDQTIANTTTVPVVDGKITVYASQPTHVIIDVIGSHP